MRSNLTSSSCLYIVDDLKCSELVTMEPEINLFDSKYGIAVQGYIRFNFDKKCMVKDVIRAIIEFYRKKGGLLCVFGDGDDGRLGLHDVYQVVTHSPSNKKRSHKPTVCLPFHQMNCSQVAAFYEHTLVVDIFGKIWVFGNGADGRLGTGNTEKVYIPKQIKFEENVHSVAVGKNHSIILTLTGNVFTFGANDKCQLGNGNTKSSLTPKCINIFEIVQVSAGSEFSAAISKDGLLFMWGANDACKCAMPKGIKKIKTPNIVQLEDKAVDIQCGSDHSLLILKNGYIYSFGYGASGRLGLYEEYDEYEYVQKPKKIDKFAVRDKSIDPHKGYKLNFVKPKQIISCAAGSMHSLCIDIDHDPWAWGENEDPDDGQCGIRAFLHEDIPIPYEIEFFIENGIKVKECFAGFKHSGILSDDNELYVFGQYNEKKKRYPFKPTKVELSQNMIVEKVSMGYTYTAMIVGVSNNKQSDYEDGDTESDSEEYTKKEEHKWNFKMHFDEKKKSVIIFISDEITRKNWGITLKKQDFDGSIRAEYRKLGKAVSSGSIKYTYPENEGPLGVLIEGRNNEKYNYQCPLVGFIV